MSKLGDKLFDLTPAWLYRSYRWVVERPRHIKWWFQRANGRLPDCDCWSYKYTLADNIRQGMDYLLRENGYIDWSGDKQHRKLKKDLEFVRQWAKEFPNIASCIVVHDSDEKKEKELTFGDKYLVLTIDELKEYEKRTEKAFKILAKNIHGLWD